MRVRYAAFDDDFTKRNLNRSHKYYTFLFYNFTIPNVPPICAQADIPENKLLYFPQSIRLWFVETVINYDNSLMLFPRKKYCEKLHGIAYKFTRTMIIAV